MSKVAELALTEKEKHRARGRAYYQANKASIIRRTTAWGKANRTKYLEMQKRCRVRRARNIEDYRRQKLYGLERADFDRMLLACNGECGICGCQMTGGGSRRLSIDHCHRTLAVRSLLCNKCNAAIGLLSDDPLLVDKAAAYLRRHGVQNS